MSGYSQKWRNRMNDTIKTMIDILKEMNADFLSVSFGEYTIIITNDKDGAEYLKESWDKYVDQSEVEE